MESSSFDVRQRFSSNVEYGLIGEIYVNSPRVLSTSLPINVFAISNSVNNQNTLLEREHHTKLTDP